MTRQLPACLYLSNFASVETAFADPSAGQQDLLLAHKPVHIPRGAAMIGIFAPDVQRRADNSAAFNMRRVS